MQSATAVHLTVLRYLSSKYSRTHNFVEIFRVFHGGSSWFFFSTSQCGKWRCRSRKARPAGVTTKNPLRSHIFFLFFISFFFSFFFFWFKQSYITSARVYTLFYFNARELARENERELVRLEFATVLWRTRDVDRRFSACDNATYYSCERTNVITLWSIGILRMIIRVKFHTLSTSNCWKIILQTDTLTRYNRIKMQRIHQLL